jgi:hypothetical protein
MGKRNEDQGERKKTLLEMKMSESEQSTNASSKPPTAKEEREVKLQDAVYPTSKPPLKTTKKRKQLIVNTRE